MASNGWYFMSFTGMNLYSYEVKDNSRFAEKIDNLFQTIIQSGISIKHGQWLSINATKAFFESKNPNGGSSIVTYKGFLKIFHLYLYSLGVSFLVFLLEILFSKRKRVIKGTKRGGRQALRCVVKAFKK